jgi:creatinine amidohydrolase
MYPKNLTWLKLRKNIEKNKPLLLPIGSVESHGAHLPISTDFLITSYVSDELAKRNNWISLPPITYTITVPSRIGNVNISRKTFGNYLNEILKHFIEFGCKKFILVLGHGGPEMKNKIKTVCTKLCKNQISISAFHILKVLEDLKLVDQTKDRHAGEWETSLILFIHEKLVGNVNIYKNPEDIKRYGVFGDPRKATKTKGKKYLKMILEKIENDIKRLKPYKFSCNW